MGILIAIEGGDGSGKGTQAKLLTEWLENNLKLKAHQVSFPRYSQASARYVGRYLDGQYGQANDIHPDLASLPYALDRFAASKEIALYLAQPDTVVVLDRYVASNMAHQGTKIDDPASRQAFYDEIMELEYEIFGIPKPDINIVLLVATSIAQSNVDSKDTANRSYTTSKRDVHEADAVHLDRAKANYEELCRLYPDTFSSIDCMEGGDKKNQRSIDSIQEDIREIVTRLIKSSN